MKKLLLILLIPVIIFADSLSTRIDILDSEVYAIEKKLNMVDTLIWEEKYQILLGDISLEQMRCIGNPKYKPDLERLLNRRRK
jgi:hypothetical protein